MKNKSKLLILLGCVGLILCIVSTINYVAVNEIQTRWTAFQDQVEQRQKFSVGIGAQLGYFGMIHNFKDYVLEGNESNLEATENNFAMLDEILENFRQLPDVSSEELQSISLLRGVIDEYKQAVSMAKQLKAQNVSPLEIHLQTKVDDSRALTALQALGEESQSRNRIAIDGVNSQLNLASLIGTFGPLIALVIIFIGTLHIGSQPLQGMGRLGALMKRAGDSKDLTLRAPVKSDDELSNLCRAFNALMDPFYDMVTNVSHSSADVDKQTSSQVNLVEQMVSNVRNQQNEIDKVAAAMNEMSATVSEVARNAAAAADAAEQANSQASNSSHIMKDTVSTIGELSQRVGSAGTAVSQLEQDSDRISDVLEVINSIAEQTNLLALNAAIEAARAGEYGRGFAVVADEVRALASRTKGSTEEVRDIIDGFQKQVKQVAQLMAEGRQHAEQGSAQTAQSGEALQAIIGSISEINDMSILIATAAEQQNQVAEEMTQSVTAIRDEADKTVTNAEETLQAVSSISDKVSELNMEASQFNIEGLIKIDK